MRILGIVTITLVCAVLAAAICLIIFGMIPDILRTWRQIRYEEKARREGKSKEAQDAAWVNVSSRVYTYDRNRKLVDLGEYRAVKR